MKDTTLLIVNILIGMLGLAFAIADELHGNTLGAIICLFLGSAWLFNTLFKLSKGEF